VELGAVTARQRRILDHGHLGIRRPQRDFRQIARRLHQLGHGDLGRPLLPLRHRWAEGHQGQGAGKGRGTGQTEKIEHLRALLIVSCVLAFRRSPSTARVLE
jgi:hypothetical protein